MEASHRALLSRRGDRASIQKLSCEFDVPSAGTVSDGDCRASAFNAAARFSVRSRLKAK